MKYSDTNVQKQKEVWRTHDGHPKSKKGGTTSKVHGRRSDGTRDKEKESNSRASTPISVMERTPSRASKSLGGPGTPTSSHDSLIEPPRRKRGYFMLLLIIKSYIFS